MSQWTHLCGLIRVDMSFRLDLEDIANVFRRNIPRGSEGPAYVIVTPENDDTYGDSIYIVGDLRSVGETEKEIQDIINWFIDVLKELDYKHNVLIRSSILQINVESKPTYIVSHTGGWDKPQIISVPHCDSSSSTVKEIE